MIVVVKWLEKELGFFLTQIRFSLCSYFMWHPDEERIRVAPVRLGWEVRFYRLFHCHAFRRVKVGFPRIRGEPRGWRQSSSRPWPQRPMSRWLARCSLPLKKIFKI
ncbi:hypothetical protein Hanom_Chr11g01005641 [Helianthus anomalus]